MSLALFLCFQLTSHLSVGETKAAELASIMINRSEKTIREWKTLFSQNEGGSREHARQVPTFGNHLVT